MLRIIAETFVNLYAVELPQLRGRRRVDGVDDVASMAWNVRGRVDGVERATSRRWRGASEV